MPSKYPTKSRKAPAAKSPAKVEGKSNGITDRDVIRLRQRMAAIRYNDGMTVGAFVAKNTDRRVALELLHRDLRAGRISFEARR